MKAILLIMIGLSSLSMAAESPRFTRAGGVVTDSVTGLVWQDNEAVEKTWVEAISYCESLTLGGNSDWRLPNKKELLSIVDYSTSKPAISSVFQNTTSDRYWSSTTGASHTSDAWYVDFSHGDTYDSNKSNNYYVRCVRSGQ